MELIYMILAFLSGILGTFLGGVRSFVIYGIIGLICFLLPIVGFQVPIVLEISLNIIFIPCIIFNAAVLATTYASKKYDIEAIEVNRSLYFTKDRVVFLCGGIAGTCGYLLLKFFDSLTLPCDHCSLVIVIIGVMGRLCIFREKGFELPSLLDLQDFKLSFAIYQIFFAVLISFVSIFFVQLTNTITIGFYISAISIFITFYNPQFPIIHHICLVVGYTMMLTNNIMLAIFLGILSQFFYIGCHHILNADKGTYIDAPALTIGVMTFIIFMIL